jgi:hypothetical protein
MSPEQAFGESVDHRSDLFSLGTVLFEMLTGKQPFASENYMGVIQNIINKDIPGVQDFNDQIPDDVAAIVDKALAKNRENRFQTAREFREAVESLLGLERISHATANLRVLLEKTTSSSILTDSGFEKKRKRKASRGGAAALGAFLVVAAASVAVVVNPSLLDYFRMPSGKSATPQAPPQQSAIGEIDGYQFDVSDLLGDEVTADSVTAQPDVGQAAESNRLEMTGDMSRAYGSSSTPEQIPVQEATPVQEPPKAPPRMGFLKIDARPSAEVYIDGVYKGDTPPAISLKLRAGEHKVECRHPRYENYREVLRIVNGELSRRVITLKKLKGMLSVVTQEGAEVYVDGKLVGVTPIRKPINLDSGPHMVTLKKTGFHTWSSEVTVEPKKTLPLKITLSPRY